MQPGEKEQNRGATLFRFCFKIDQLIIIWFGVNLTHDLNHSNYAFVIINFSSQKDHFNFHFVFGQFQE